MNFYKGGIKSFTYWELTPFEMLSKNYLEKLDFSWLKTE